MQKDLTGQQFGNWRLTRKLGVGGFASVYHGQHIYLPKKQAAIKILHLLDLDEQQFRWEAKLLNELEHRHIVGLLDYGIQQETPFLVLAYAPEGSLRARHPKGNQVPLTIIVQYLKETASALQYAHDKGILHRDIKPDNILIGHSGDLLLSDFGIAKLLQTDRSATTSTGGTPIIWLPNNFKMVYQQRRVTNTRWQPSCMNGLLAGFLSTERTSQHGAINIHPCQYHHYVITTLHCPNT